MSLHLEKQLTFYGSYHHNPVNVIIHVICVPLLLMTALLLGTNTPALIPLPDAFQLKQLPPNLGVISALLYASLYILMEPVAGALVAPLILLGTAYANHLTSTYGRTANLWALALHVASWLVQFVGHGVFEGRAPALMDNLVQALFMAPFFVWMEILFFFGYRPALKGRVDVAVQKETERFRRSKASPNAGHGQVPH